jgi:hypothetical protein
VRAEQERRAAPLETEAEWLVRNATAAAAAAGSEAPPVVGPEGTGEGDEWDPGDEWTDIRTANFTELYTAEYGSDWLREFPDTPAGYRSAPRPSCTYTSSLVHSALPSETPAGYPSAPRPPHAPHDP